MSAPHGRFIWYELATTDPAAAACFYGDVIGWTAKESGTPGIEYSILSTGDAMVAGLMALPEHLRSAGVPPHWTGYIAVDDVDEYARRVQEAGGTVHRAPADIPGVGRFAVVADPQGAVFQLFKPLGGPPDGAPPAMGMPGRIGWRELYAADGAAAWDFYAGLFGWTKVQAIPMGPMGSYQIFATGEGPVGGMMTRMCPEQPPAWGYYVNVAGLDSAIGRVTEGGGKVLNGPVEVPGGAWIVNCLDPQGAYFSLVSPAR